MQIQLISHASVIVQHEETLLWTDPWLFGKAFNNSWSLFPEPNPAQVPYERIRYIWISHEHPDHFHIPTLKALPEAFKSRVTVLFQETNSDKLFDAMAAMGYRHFQSLPHRKRVELAPGFSVYCYQSHLIDSCLGIISDRGEVVLDVNDAELSTRDCQRILRDLERVDVCLNQFSLAGYRGFHDRDRHLPKMARQKLAQMLQNHRDLRAGVTIPFASLVYFSTEDNRYMNRYANTPRGVYQAFQNEGLRCALMYPGSTLDWREPLDVEPTLQEYDRLLASLESLPYEEPPLVPEPQLTQAFDRFFELMHDRYPKLILRTIQPLDIYVTDLQKAFRLDLYRQQYAVIPLAEAECDIAVYSQPLLFAFQFPYGFETLAVSARVTVHRNYGRWQRFKRLCILNSADIHLKPRYLLRPRNSRYLLKRLQSSLLGQVMTRLRRQTELLGEPAPL